MENSLHILLTSDERVICAPLKNYLCNLGHQVEIVRDGHTALKKFNAQHMTWLSLISVCPASTTLNSWQKFSTTGKKRRLCSFLEMIP